MNGGVGRSATQKTTAQGGGAVSHVHVHHSYKLPDFLNNIKLTHIKLGYHYLISYLLTLGLVPLIIILITQAKQVTPDDLRQLQIQFQYNLMSVIICFSLLVFGSTFYILTRPRPVYLVDFSCYRPLDNLKVPFQFFIDRIRAAGSFYESSIEFQRKILERSGLGGETYLPKAMHLVPPKPNMQAAREEAEEVIFGVLDNLFANTKIKPKEIEISVVISSLFNPTTSLSSMILFNPTTSLSSMILFNPTTSLSSMIINKYKLNGDIKSFNLGGMGCGAGIMAIDLAKDLLQVHRNTYAVVVSTENITQNLYLGIKKSMLIPNCLFRLGGAAILLSNKSSEMKRSKYKLLRIVRTHKGANDQAFQCVYQQQDNDVKIGVSLSKDLMATAGEALKTNITTLGPLVLPMSEQILFLAMFVIKEVFNKKVKNYVPDFKLALDHLCIHAGGRAVIDELERNLELTPVHVEASKMSLLRFGNTSSSSIWYELGFIEAKGRTKGGHRVWQIAFGRAWEAIRDVEGSKNGAWEDCIDDYPVEAV
ncbi:Very-long-chain 3-oxoacyl-CoA synthase [Handroanthus impetiginosus]|uniref:3-ketoacyl-CoA synthase n=1 Tax=Handroanthus impetiginosus TaxID=429701 RepID=A0A2G9HCI5_9LAMI|nr:Very-long-chain 3-oxoacyl-CoA synthase [Handroanthus impetiginosus]